MNYFIYSRKSFNADFTVCTQGNRSLHILQYIRATMATLLKPTITFLKKTTQSCFSKKGRVLKIAVFSYLEPSILFNSDDFL